MVADGQFNDPLTQAVEAQSVSRRSFGEQRMTGEAGNGIDLQGKRLQRRRPTIQSTREKPRHPRA